MSWLEDQPTTNVVSILNVSCFNSTTTKSFAFNLTNKQLKSIWNSSDLECSLTGNLTTINETSAKLVNISPYLDVNQIGFQVLVIMLFSTCISVCSSVNRRKENRTIARMPRGESPSTGIVRSQASRDLLMCWRVWVLSCLSLNS